MKEIKNSFFFFSCIVAGACPIILRHGQLFCQIIVEVHKYATYNNAAFVPSKQQHARRGGRVRLSR
jgi:hypothetical protein